MSEKTSSVLINKIRYNHLKILFLRCVNGNCEPYQVLNEMYEIGHCINIYFDLMSESSQQLDRKQWVDNFTLYWRPVFDEELTKMALIYCFKEASMDPNLYL